MAREDAVFLNAADLIEYVEVTPETRERVRRAVGAELRAGLSEGARKAVADAYRAKGEAVPEWLR